MKNYFSRSLSLSFTLCLLLWLTVLLPAAATTYIVNSALDNGVPGTLRSILAMANAGDTVTFPAFFPATVIVLTNGNCGLTLSKNVTIDASAVSGGIQINGNNSNTVFTVSYGVTAVLNALTITNGYNPSYRGSSGGGIYNMGGTLILNRCNVTRNTSYGAASVGGAGGGIYNYMGTMTLNNCTVSGNTVSSSGSTPSNGGGIYNFEGTATLNSCTVAGNTAKGNGGGIYNYAPSTLTLNSCTVASNSTSSSSIGSSNIGGGIYSISSYGANMVAVANTIIAENSAGSGADIYADSTVIYGGMNLVPVATGDALDSTTLFVITNAPNLALLGNYGGPTPTMPPLAGSAAIDAGSDTANSFLTDQRGLPRASGAHVDIGAVEFQQSNSCLTLPPSGMTAVSANSATATFNGVVGPMDYNNNVTFSCTFNFGTTTNYGSTISANPGSFYNVSNTLNNLKPGVTYHYQLYASSGSTNYTGGDMVFITPSLSTTLTLTSSASQILFTQPVTFTATLNPVKMTGEIVTFYNGTNIIGAATLTNGIAELSVRSLPTGTNLITANYGGDGTYATSVSRNVSVIVNVNAPLATAATASPINASGATLNAIINPGGAPTSYYFQYGLTTNFSSTTTTGNLVAVLTNINVSSVLTSLAPDTEYYYQVVAWNNAGSSTNAGNFTTGNFDLVTTNGDDSNAGTLRNILATAGSNDTVSFAADLSGTTIMLTNGGLTLAANITIDASTLSGGIQINGYGSNTVFTVDSNATIVLSSLTITNASNLNGDGGGINNAGVLTLNASIVCETIAINGGGIYNSGTLTLNSNTIWGNVSTYGNTSTNGGGGIYNVGTLILNTNIIFGNYSESKGGGIYNNGTATLNESTVSENYSTYYGGGIYNNSALTLNSSTLSENTTDAGGGGGVFTTSGTLTLNESTVAENNAASSGGGGVYSLGTVILNASTVSANSVYNNSGGGIYNNNTLIMNNTIVAGNYDNYSTANISSPQYISGGTNLISGNPMLAPLGNYGGPTQTMPPLPGSPVIDAGSNGANIFATDQRGLPRVSGTQVDLGATELQQGMITTLPASGNAAAQTTLNGSITLNDPVLNWYFQSITNAGTNVVNWFQYGTSTAYSSFSPTNTGLTFIPSGNSVAISQPIGGLAANTTYHYQLLANGTATNAGSDVTFTTLSIGITPTLTGGTFSSSGFQFTFTNVTGAGFTVYASTNIALPFTQWNNLGTATETPAGFGRYQFTDPSAMTNGQNFYRVTSP